MLNKIIRNRKGIFITATGTDIGKTYISALIVKQLRDNQINAGYYKPVLSGANVKGNTVILNDAEYVCQFTGLAEHPEKLVSYIFKAAVSPHLASKFESNIKISKETILKDFTKLSQRYEFLVTEGCGGILCPLSIPDSPLPFSNKIQSELLMLPNIIKLLELDIIIVADSGLGTINLVLLTVEYARQQNINIVGIILNHYDKDNIVHNDNKKQIEFLTNLPILFCVPTAFESLKYSLK